MPRKKPNKNKPKAFFIMPFDPEFQSIYDQLLRPTLESCGYQVHTAKLNNQQSIMKDIVVSISEAYIVIADVSLANMNVYYELGVAHTLGKNVIHISQDLSKLPFDLRPYRTLQYSTHIAKVSEFVEEFKAVAKGALDGTVIFGNPVTDFIPHEERTDVTRQQPFLSQLLALVHRAVSNAKDTAL